MAVGMIIVIINAALLLLYLCLMIQFIVLPRLRTWAPHLVHRTSELASRCRGGISGMAVPCLSHRRESFTFKFTTEPVLDVAAAGS